MTTSLLQFTFCIVSQLHHVGGIDVAKMYNSQKIYLILILLPILSFTLSFASEQLFVKITYIEGICLIKRKEAKEWREAKLNDLLYSGDRVHTKSDTKVELKFFDGSVVRLAENTLLVIKTLKKDEKNKKNEVRIKVIIGNIWNYIKRAVGYTSEHEAKTPAAILGVRGTTYRVEIKKDGTTLVRVYKGEVEVKTYLEVYREIKKGEEPKKRIWPPEEVKGPEEVTMEEWVRIVKEMQQIVVYKDKPPKEVSKFDIKEDMKLPWVRWNMERDKLIE